MEIMGRCDLDKPGEGRGLCQFGGYVFRTKHWEEILNINENMFLDTTKPSL